MGGKNGCYPDLFLLGLFVTLETAVTPLLKGVFPTFSNTLPSISAPVRGNNWKNSGDEYGKSVNSPVSKEYR